MFRRAFAIVFFLFLAGGSLLADEATLQSASRPVPESVAAGIRAVLGSDALTVSLDGQPVAHIWLKGELSKAASPSSELGVQFGAIQAGSLVGAVEIVGKWSDYKANPIRPGVYTLRYGIMPADGAHMGVSIYRDFLMMVDPSADLDPAAMDLAYVLEGSSQASGVTHPAVLALYPVWEEVSDPKMIKNDLDQWTLAVKFGGQVLGLVISGHGELH